LTVVAVSLLIFIAVLPFARVKLPEIWAFIPLYESALFVNDLGLAPTARLRRAARSGQKCLDLGLRGNDIRPPLRFIARRGPVRLG
ncbi:MAG: hypothetical protein M3R18_05415, partial [Pseudomonadota bacterium]|nr:hypothetical protein [Pseudomonadota bacterium]